MDLNKTPKVIDGFEVDWITIEVERPWIHEGDDRIEVLISLSIYGTTNIDAMYDGGVEPFEKALYEYTGVVLRLVDNSIETTLRNFTLIEEGKPRPADDCLKMEFSNII